MSWFAQNTCIIMSGFVSFPLFSTGFVPYIIAPRHFQESIASSSNLYHLWACFLLCHRLSCATLYGPISIPSVLYLAYLQLESHGFFSFDYNKSGEDKGDFPVSTSNKVKIPSWTFCSFLPSLPDHLHYWALEGGVYRKWFWTCHCGGPSPSVQKLPDLRDKNKAKWWARKLLCSHQQVDLWSQVDFTNAADSQDYHYQEVKWNGLNQTGLFILNYMLKVNLINLYWILNLFARYCKESRHQSKMERWKGAQTFRFFAADLPFLNKTFFHLRCRLILTLVLKHWSSLPSMAAISSQGQSELIWGCFILKVLTSGSKCSHLFLERVEL